MNLPLHVHELCDRPENFYLCIPEFPTNKISYWGALIVFIINHLFLTNIAINNHKGFNSVIFT